MTVLLISVALILVSLMIFAIYDLTEAAVFRSNHTPKVGWKLLDIFQALNDIAEELIYVWVYVLVGAIVYVMLT